MMTSPRWGENLEQENYGKSKKVLFTNFLLQYFATPNEEQMNVRLENMMKQLGIKYDRNNTRDYLELAYVLCDVLAYPSSDAAEVHSQSTRAYLDIQVERQEQRQVNNFKCPCCDSIVIKPIGAQRQGISPRHQVNNNMNDQIVDPQQQQKKIGMLGKLGEANCALSVVTFETAILMVPVFVLFGSFAIITNFISSNIYKEDSKGQILEPAYISYNMPLAISFGSQQFYLTDFSRNAALAQHWIGIIIILWFIFNYLMYEKLYINIKKAHNISKSIKNYSLLCTKMPLIYQKQVIRRYIQIMLDNYYQNHNYERNYRIKANIQKINYTKPYGFSYIISPQYEKLSNLVKQEKKIFKLWIEYRKTNYEFPYEEKKRQQRYNKFKKMRVQKYKAYLDMVSKNNKLFTEEQQVTHADTLITFNSELIPALILIAQKENMSVCHSITKTSLGKMRTKELFWMAAPEPEDINWDQFGQGSCKTACRMLLTTMVTVFALLLSLLVNYFFLMSKEYVSASNTESRDGFFEKNMVKILYSTPIFISNFLLKVLLGYLARNWEKHKTNSDIQISLGHKALFFMLINSIFIPVLINIIYKKNIYGVGGLAEEVFYFSITNAICNVVLKIKYLNLSFIWLKVKIWYSHMVCNKWESTQKQLNVASQYLFFDHGLEYTSVTFTFLYSCFFLSLQPIIAFFSIIELFLLSFFLDISLLTSCKMPNPSGSQINDSLSKLLGYGSFSYALGSVIWTNIYARQVTHIRVEDFIGLVLSLIPIIYQIFQNDTHPLQRDAENNKKIFVSNGEQPIDAQKQFRESIQQKLKMSYQQQKWKFNTEYDRLNPFTAFAAIKEYNNEVQTNKDRLPKNVSKKTLLSTTNYFNYDDETFIRYGGLYNFV